MDNIPRSMVSLASPLMCLGRGFPLAVDAPSWPVVEVFSATFMSEIQL